MLDRTDKHRAMFAEMSPCQGYRRSALKAAIIPTIFVLAVVWRNVSGSQKRDLQKTHNCQKRDPRWQKFGERRQSMKFQTARTLEPSNSTMPQLRCCRTTRMSAYGILLNSAGTGRPWRKSSWREGKRRGGTAEIFAAQSTAHAIVTPASSTIRRVRGGVGGTLEDRGKGGGGWGPSPNSSRSKFFIYSSALTSSAKQVGG